MDSAPHRDDVLMGRVRTARAVREDRSVTRAGRCGDGGFLFKTENNLDEPKS